jgi:hypothetical protein
MLLRHKLEFGTTKRLAPKANGFAHDLLSLTKSQVMGMDQHVIEQVVLQRVDDEAAAVRDKLLNGQISSLSHEERCAWVRFIMSLRLRQPSVISLLRDGARQTLRQKLTDAPDHNESIAIISTFPTIEEWTEAAFPGAIENFGLSFFHELINDEAIGTRLLQLRWWIWKFDQQDHPLLLGDNPCVFAGGIDNPNLAVMLPISPKAAFIATRGETVAQELSRANGKRLSSNFNDATVRQAEKYVYAVDEASRKFIEIRRPSKRL